MPSGNTDDGTGDSTGGGADSKRLGLVMVIVICVLVLIFLAAFVAAIRWKRRSRRTKGGSGVKLGTEEFVMTSVTLSGEDSNSVGRGDVDGTGRLLTGTNFVWAGDADQTT